MRLVQILGSCIAINALAFVLGMDYAFSGDGAKPGPFLSIAGPIATVVSWPAVWIQNVLPLGRPADTVIGIGLVALIESLIISLLLCAGGRMRHRAQ